MCLALIALDSHPGYSLIVAANRDEFYDRPTAPAAFWAEAPSVLAGRDLKAGGTWLGIDRAGRFAVVTNYRQGKRERTAPLSRGHLVSNFLTTDTGARDHFTQVERDGGHYNGFNLIAGDGHELLYYSNRGGRIRALPEGVYGLSNHLVDTAWPKVTSIKRGCGALWSDHGSELTANLLALLSDRTRPPDELLPRTGAGLAWERLLSSAFVVSPHYGTRSSTVLLIGRDGWVEFVERTFGPIGAVGEQLHFEFRIVRPAGTGRPVL
jgi:uncharacterized protein with NRDE domain